jgi:hypothetical protein
MKQIFCIEITFINIQTNQKKGRKKTPINKIRDEKGDITININVIQRIIREYFENLRSNYLENLKENRYVCRYTGTIKIEPLEYKPLKQIYNK